jgi:XTP/dITP diphosphohydrolase
VSEKYGLDCFADDSGLEVDALNGAPGVYSARYAGGERSDGRNIDKLLEELRTKNIRAAQFKTVIALNANGQQTLFTGLVRGTITTAPRGINGFGYDPVFVPDGYETTFAEMDQQAKALISHRGIAVRKLIAALSESE